jgi:hypothetical protein
VRQRLGGQKLVYCGNVNATIIEAAPKSALVGLGELGTTIDLDPEAIEMNILAFNHADHHPTEGFKVAQIAPGEITLT